MIPNRLDVGCGHLPTGDVNIDRFKSSRWSPDMPFNAGFETSSSPYRLDLIADAEHLPFRDKSFNEVYSAHTIEHVDHPQQMVKEMERVAVKTVSIRCPAMFAHGHRGNPFHKWTFKQSWFRALGYLTEINWEPIEWPPIGPVRISIRRMNEIIATKDLGSDS